jgi:hypothetical protein
VSTLSDLVEEHTALGTIEIEHLHRLAGDWQLIADLSFADLLLWVAIDHGAEQQAGFVCVAQVRPTTGPTAYHDDHVGRIISHARPARGDPGPSPRRSRRHRGHRPGHEPLHGPQPRAAGDELPQHRR